MTFIDEENIEQDKNSEKKQENEDYKVKYLSGMYENWFLDYASYVILERAVPYLLDGLKPVHRRILHSMKKLDDGRYNKVANIIGHTMQYHPHGDASIGDALVQLGQKELLVDTQGNWGNIYTGDSAAAPRYIEARLTKFALEVVFNPKTTHWKLSYDGRNKEPIALPVKFPLLLALGVEGIAVGLASKILPHNFNELIDASISHLRKEDFELYPDFLTAGMADVTKYNDGLRGGKVRVRAKITKIDKRTLAITEIPYGKTTTNLIDSILSANDKGKIKIKKIDDNTAAEVEVLIHLGAGVSADKTIDALYAFTDCEVSISPNSCVIIDDKPNFMGVKDILRHSTDNTLRLLKLELEIRKQELEETWHLASLEKIFIENKIYLDIEECETWEAIIETIDSGLEPFKAKLKRPVTYEDIVKLTEIKIKRISKYDAFKADDYIKSIEDEIEKINYNLEHIVDFTIKYYERIKEKFGKDRQRRTELRSFDVIEATKVVVANEKLYVNRKEGFYGISLKKEEFVCDISDIDDVIVFLRNGKYIISKVSEKAFFGKDIIHIARFKRNDERTIYNVVYREGKSGKIMIKRFAVSRITRDKEYDVSKGNEGSRILYFSANPNGEAETIRVTLKPKPRLKKPNFEFDFSTLTIKGRNAMGNILTKHAIHRIVMKEKGISTLGDRTIWFDPDVRKLNVDGRGIKLGKFSGDDKIMTITKSGKAQLLTYDLSTFFEEDLELIQKYKADTVFSVVFYDAEQRYYYIKRFCMENTEKQISIIGDAQGSRLEKLLVDKYPRVEIKFGGKDAHRLNEIIDIATFIGIKGYKARGKRATSYEVEAINRIEPSIVEEEVEQYKENNDIDFEIIRPDSEDSENAEQTKLF
ncbi:MAG: DNA topoisomerase IV [Bacteroidia bacterium]|nr:MAG: DNA topoisomerase IV [Bacteroidia bacterium]